MKRLYEKFIRFRQTQANIRVAEQLRNSEFQNETFAYVYRHISEGKIDKLLEKS